MRQIFPILLFLTTLSVNMMAQANFVEGFILLSRTDTLRGFINDKNYQKNALYCDFRKTRNETPTRYFPSDIFGYYNGKYYVSKKLNIEGRDTVFFLEYLIDGEMDFYFRQDEDKRNHFYVSKDSTLIYELRYSKATTQIENRTYEKESKEFVGVLKYLTQDYPEFASEIESTIKPRHTNLVRLGEDYHNYICKDKECIVYNKRSPFKFSFEVSGGYSIGGSTKKSDLYDYQKLDNSFFGAAIFVNNAEFNEKIQLGFGYFSEGRFARVRKNSEGKLRDSLIYNMTKIPLSLGYSSTKMGFSPTFHTTLNLTFVRKDVNMRFAFMPGLQYNLRKLYIRTYIEMDFNSILIIPYSYYSTNFGVCMGFRI